MLNDWFNNENKHYYYYGSSEPLRKKTIPSKTTHLIFENYNHPIDNCIPKNVISISFGNDFNQPINKKSITNGVLCLKFGKAFNQSIENIPSSVTQLSLDWNYGLKTEFYNYVMQNNYYYEKTPLTSFYIFTYQPLTDLERNEKIMNMLNDLANVNFISKDDEIIDINPYLHTNDVDEIIKNNLNNNTLTTTELEHTRHNLSRYIINKVAQQISTNNKNRFKEYLSITQNSFEESMMFIPNSVLKHLEIIEINNYEFYKINKMRLKTKKVIYNKYKYRTYKLVPSLYKNKNFESIFSYEILYTQEFASKISEELTSVVFNPIRIARICKQYGITFEEYNNFL